MKPANPSRITEMATAYWASGALLALNEIGVFGALGAGARSATDLAAELDCDERSLTMLLAAGASLGLLRQQDGGYANGADASVFLVPGGPAYLGGALKYALDTFEAWGRLAQGVRTGRPQVAEETYLGDDASRTERFVRAMHGRALGVCRGIAQSIDLSGHRRLLDVAGGSGAFSILFCEKTPGLRSTVCDLGPILAVSRTLIAEAGLADRIDTSTWDLRTSDLPSGHDVALVSGILHRLSAADATAVLRKVHAALPPGGAVYLADVMLDDTGVGPPPAALFALNMMLTAPRGGAHRAADHVDWLHEVGFVDGAVRTLPPPALHSVVTARRP